MIREEVVEQFNKDIELRNQRSIHSKTIRYRETYIKNRLRGDYSIQVDEWDEFERERELKEALEWQLKQKNIKGEIDMSKRRVLVRLSKAFNNIEVEVDGIETPQEYTHEMEWAYNEAITLIDKLPNEKIDDSIRNPQGQKQYTPKQYVEHKEITSKPANGVYTAQHITTKFYKGKQLDTMLKGLNSGKYTLEQINGLQSWPEMQALVYPPKTY